MHEPVSPAAQPIAEQAATAAALEARYGAKRGRSFDKRFGWAAAGLLVLAGIGFLFFSGWQNANNIEFQTIDFNVVDEHETTVKFEVTAAADAQVACAVEALSPSKATVGWNVIEVPESGARTHTVTTSLTTTMRAVAAEVRSCWVLADNT